MFLYLLAFYFLLALFPTLLFLVSLGDDAPQGPDHRKKIGPAAERAADGL